MSVKTVQHSPELDDVVSVGSLRPLRWRTANFFGRILGCNPIQTGPNEQPMHEERRHFHLWMKRALFSSNTAERSNVKRAKWQIIFKLPCVYNKGSGVTNSLRHNPVVYDSDINIGNLLMLWGMQLGL